MIRNHTQVVPPFVAQALANRRVLIVGGDCRREQLARLRETFPQTEFVWRPTRESDASTSTFDRLVVCDSIDIVIVLMLARHSHTKGARRLCSACGKPLLWCWRPTAAAIIRAIEQHAKVRLADN